MRTAGLVVKNMKLKVQLFTLCSTDVDTISSSPKYFLAFYLSKCYSSQLSCRPCSLGFLANCLGLSSQHKSHAEVLIGVYDKIYMKYIKDLKGAW